MTSLTQTSALPLPRPTHLTYKRSRVGGGYFGASRPQRRKCNGTPAFCKTIQSDHHIPEGGFFANP